MSEKAKVDKPSKARVNKYGFLAMWVAAQGLGWLGLIILFETGLMSAIGSLFGDSNWAIAPIIATGVGIPTTLLQKLALYLGFGRWFTGWTRANLIGWFLGSFGLVTLLEMGVNGGGTFDFILQILTLMLLPSLAQAWILSRYVQRVWLWLVATVTASTVLVSVSQQLGDGNWEIVSSFGAYALVTGLTLLWLFGMQRNETKLKASVDSSRLEDKAETDAAETDDVELEELANRK